MLLQPLYYVYFVYKWGTKGLMEFEDKSDMNLWVVEHGNSCRYLKVISGFTLTERRQDANSRKN